MWLWIFYKKQCFLELHKILTSAKMPDFFFTESSLKGMVPDGAKLIYVQPIVLEQLKSGMMVFDQESPDKIYGRLSCTMTEID